MITFGTRGAFGIKSAFGFMKAFGIITNFGTESLCGMKTRVRLDKSGSARKPFRHNSLFQQDGPFRHSRVRHGMGFRYSACLRQVKPDRHGASSARRTGSAFSRPALANAFGLIRVRLRLPVLQSFRHSDAMQHFDARPVPCMEPDSHLKPGFSLGSMEFSRSFELRARHA